MAGQPEKRSTLGHLLNVSIPFSAENPVWRLICKGVSELTEEFNPDTDEQQFICEDVKTTILKTYAPSFEISMGYQKDDLIQYYFDVMSRRLPTGENTNIEYIRFNKNETMFGTNNQFIGVKFKANVYFSSVGGAGDDYLTSVMNIAATGNPEVGYVSVTDTGNDKNFTWNKADIEVPFVTSFIKNPSGNPETIPMNGYYSGLSLSGASFGINGKGSSGNKIELKTDSDNGLSGTDVTVDSTGNWTMTITVASGTTGNRNIAFVQKDNKTPTPNQSVSTKVYTVNVSNPGS